MRFSVVIPTYNRAQTLRQALRSALDQESGDDEILVIDDGSTDGTADMVQREFPAVRLIRQENRGPATARNRGIRDARGEIIAFIDDDCVAPPDWLALLADGYARYPDVAGVGGYLEATPEMLATNHIAQYEQYVAHTLYRAGKEEVLGGFECPAGGTSNMSYKRDVLLAVGGFDETFPYAAGEDADLKWRICQEGHQLLYLPLRVLHFQPYTWAAFQRRQITRGRGSLYFDRKHAQVPSRGRLLLRALKRGLLFWPTLARVGPTLAWVRLWAGWYECWGQWLERGKIIRRLG